MGRHNPYFNRWFSAMPVGDYLFNDKLGHNPYFNRWFSAIVLRKLPPSLDIGSQSLF